jgi:hypothetical protein
MALCKPVLTNFGVTVEYHKVTNINISWHNRTCFVDVASYINQDLREQEKSPILSRYYEFIDTAFLFDVEANIVEQVYEKLKQLPEWYNATDC